MTLTDLYRKTLEKLEVAAAGEPVAPEDSQFMASKYVLLWNQLKVLDLVSWSVNEPVPDEAAMPLINMMAHASADDFGDSPARYDGAIGLPQPSLAERQLRQIHARDYVSTPATSEYL